MSPQEGRSAQQFQAVLAQAPDAFVAMARDGRITEWNVQAQRTFGWTREEALGRTVAELLVPPEARDEHRRGLARILNGEPSRILNRPIEVDALTHDGRPVPVELTIAAVGEGEAMVFNAFLRDISRRREHERALREAEDRFRRAFDEAPIGMALVALDGRFLRVNDALCGIVGYPPEHLVRIGYGDLTHPHDRQADEEFAQRVLAGEDGTYEREKRYLHADGRIVWVQLNVSLSRDADGRPAHFISQIQDVTERRGLEGRLKQLARRDHLTGLLNRRGFEEELDRRLAHARRYGRSGAVLVLDLDGFKAVNDTHGHQAGDAVLRAVAGVLRERLRETDVVARLGGDEFAAVLPESDADGAGTVVASLGAAIDGHVETVGDGTPLAVTVSIGCVLFDGTRSGPDVLAAADARMYESKQRAAAQQRPA